MLVSIQITAMNSTFKSFILQSLKATDIFEIEMIQSLWSGYGSIVRYGVIGGEQQTIVIKHICLPNSKTHPRGWNTNLSHQRKLKSYQVESEWYKNWSDYRNTNIRMPNCFGILQEGEETCFFFIRKMILRFFKS